VSVLYIALPAALVLASIFLLGFIWLIRGGQMDDLSTPPVRMLFDDDDIVTPQKKDTAPTEPAKKE
jgi:cbb3-type cytochrome oxidase maturation protein